MRIAAIDLGTNSFHLAVAEVQPDGTFVPLVREKEMLRLGDAVSRHGYIPPDTADKAVETVRRFRMLGEAADADEIVAKGTSALRTAVNGDLVVDRFEHEAGVEVEVIDGLEEARLIFSAIRASVLIEPAPALCFDLGGGSLEIMVGDAGGLHWATSEPIGVARLTSELVTSDPLGKEDRRRLKDRLTGVLAPVAKQVDRYQPRLVVGSSGTLEALAHMVAARRSGKVPVSLNQLTFTRDEFLPLHKQIIGAKVSERRRMPGLDPGRVDLIAAGSMFLATAMDLFDFDQLTVSEWALREGIVLDAIRHHDAADWSEDPRALRRASVQSLARRCNWPESHSRHVAKLATDLFDATGPLHELDARDRELLEYAGLLHDIGEHVDHQAHDKHAAYLLRYGRLRGFDPEEIATLTAVVRWHRRGDPKGSDEYLAPLDSDGRNRVRRLAALLRIADGLDRGRRDTVRGVTVGTNPSLVTVRVHSEDDPELELWGARRKRELFEKTFDRDLEFIAVRMGGG